MRSETRMTPPAVRIPRSAPALTMHRRPIGGGQVKRPTSDQVVLELGSMPSNTRTSPLEVTNTARSSMPAPPSRVHEPIAISVEPRVISAPNGYFVAAPVIDCTPRYQTSWLFCGMNHNLF